MPFYDPVKERAKIKKEKGKEWYEEGRHYSNQKRKRVLKMYKENKRTPKNAGEMTVNIPLRKRLVVHCERDWFPISFLVVFHW